MRRVDAITSLFWISGAMIMLPAVISMEYYMGRQVDSDIDKYVTKENMNFAGSGCQRWQFKFQKTLQLTVEDFLDYDDCETMCRVVFMPYGKFTGVYQSQPVDYREKFSKHSGLPEPTDFQTCTPEENQRIWRGGSLSHAKRQTTHKSITVIKRTEANIRSSSNLEAIYTEFDSPQLPIKSASALVSVVFA
ncbi:hypothetical protein BCR37DRAFT_389145 [Protomyces lactucae-debilis]|uniref:Uncharacterized protein n=1 Tax=Protomyces lactucae-debilis TaxID=2754530 RepID=A0A1Y2F0C2_PROLT|nr:uncharacterized protein BCR37DRAFT_389145 [Protomyces lactucae-debilis]ORY77328.1 hypothetical protein BCR37DRAFT_389145 [Protomyces lactucae-debilis]